MFKTSGRASFLIILFQFLQYYVFVVFSGDAFAFFHWHFYCDSFSREEDCIQNLCTQRTFGNYWAFAVFSGPDLIANLSDGLKIMDPGFITCDDIGKLLFVIFWKHLKQLFGHFNPWPLLLVSQQMWHSSSRNLSDFQMLLQNKVNRWKWYAYLSCNITNCKSGISFNDFLYFGNNFFTRCRFWPTWFRCIFDGLYTRLKFLFPPPNCVIRHTRRSKSSRNFSHQLLQRTTKFWASFDVSPYFIFFVDASTNHFYCSGQWLRVFKWQILCLTLSLTCTFIHHCVDIE